MNNSDCDDIIKINIDILKLVEFYFSDSNLKRDKYLFNIIDSNKNEWIELSKLNEFKKFSDIVSKCEILKYNYKDQLKSIFNNSKIVLVSEDNSKIKRLVWPIPKLTANELKEIDERTIYIEPITNELGTHDLITLLFTTNNNNNTTNNQQQEEIIKYISIPKFTDKTLKGYAFIEFSTSEQSKQAIENIYSSPDKYHHLIAISKIEYLEKKAQFSYLSNQSRFLKIGNIPTIIQNKPTTTTTYNNSSSSSSSNGNEDDGLMVIDNSTTTTTTNNKKIPIPIKMNKPYLWKHFDKETDIKVTYLEYLNGSDKAIIKFSTLLDIQHAIDQFQLGEIKIYNNTLNIIEMTNDEILKLKSKMQSYEKNKQSNKTIE